MTIPRAAPFLVLFAVAGCQKQVPASPPVREVAAPAPTPAAPAKMVTMVCRNSQSGASAECGTPNAVMVGVKEK